MLINKHKLSNKNSFFFTIIAKTNDAHSCTLNSAAILLCVCDEKSPPLVLLLFTLHRRKKTKILFRPHAPSPLFLSNSVCGYLKILEINDDFTSLKNRR